MRVLFVGFNREYVNRTVSVLLRALRANHDLGCYGPGFQGDDALRSGPEAWIDAHGPYDLLLFDSYVVEHDAIAARPKPFTGDCIHFSPQSFREHGPGLQRFVQHYPGKKAFIVNWDVYSVGEERIEQLEGCGCYVLDPSMARLTMAEKEDAFGPTVASAHRGFWGGAGTDHWVSFVRRHRERVLEVPHALGLEQMSLTPLEARSQLFCVPGTSYQERQSVYGFLTTAQRLRQLHHKVEDRLYSYRRQSLTPARMRAIHLRYDSDIASSRLAYASGSIHRTPVRKYFEIPALGTVPIGQSCEGFSELGFVDGNNFVVAETADAVKEVLRGYDEAEAQTIASRARQMVIELHSEPARARQLAESFGRITAGPFNGSYWHNGVYCHRQ
jgi:hypothetical protein